STQCCGADPGSRCFRSRTSSAPLRYAYAALHPGNEVREMERSESARATSAAESRYRIDAPNSQPRTVKVIALDAAAERVAKRIAQGPWRRATFFTSLSDDGARR